MQKTIVVLGMGGTIAGVGQPGGGSVGYQAGQINAQALLHGIGVPAGYALQAEQVAQLDSKDMHDDAWYALARACMAHLARPEVAALVITHGTDTLEESAWFLHCVLPLGKPVVLTCAMRPATALSPDGPANVRDALSCAADARAQQLARVAQAVLVVVGAEVHSAQHIRKDHPYRVHAFSSGGCGPLGWVEEGQLRWGELPLAQVPAAALDEQVSQDAAALPSAPLPAPPWPWVEVLTSHAGARPQVIDVLAAAGVQGLVIAGTGNGTVHGAWLPALQRARAAGVLVRRCTRCAQGQVVQALGQEDAEVTFLAPYKARISLMLHLLNLPHLVRAA